MTGLSGFKATSAFDAPKPPAPEAKVMPRALFASTTAGWEGSVIEIRTGRLRSWWHDLDDILASIETGEARDLEQAVLDIERLRDTLDDLVRSNHGSSVPPDRPPR